MATPATFETVCAYKQTKEGIWAQNPVRKPSVICCSICFSPASNLITYYFYGPQHVWRYTPEGIVRRISLLILEGTLIKWPVLVCVRVSLTGIINWAPNLTISRNKYNSQIFPQKPEKTSIDSTLWGGEAIVLYNVCFYTTEINLREKFIVKERCGCRDTSRTLWQVMDESYNNSASKWKGVNQYFKMQGWESA